VKEKLLIVGNGMASVRLVEALVRQAPEAFDITVVGSEQRAGYNRVLLSALLAKDVTEDEIILKDRAWYQAWNVHLISGDAVVSIDPLERSAVLTSGMMIPFNHCVFATGSHPIRLPIQGMNKPGVITFRDLDDVEVMENAAASHKKVAVIGGGLLGIEAAYGLAKRGADVTLVHVMDRLMERQLDAPAALLLKQAMRRKGVKVLLEKKTVAVSGDAVATGLIFDDAVRLEADLVICAVGIKPNADLAKATGLTVNRGIVVDDAMATSVHGFYAIGECAEHQGIAYGLVEPAYAQAEVLAANLIGHSRIFETMVLSTNLKVSGLPVFSAGAFIGGENTHAITLQDRKTGAYRKLVLEGDRLTGCVLVGETEDALWYLDLIRKGVDISAARQSLIHGRTYAEAALGQHTIPEAA
jgi:nitrite reductase (NADH) large subunit